MSGILVPLSSKSNACKKRQKKSNACGKNCQELSGIVVPLSSKSKCLQKKAKKIQCLRKNCQAFEFEIKCRRKKEKKIQCLRKKMSGIGVRNQMPAEKIVRHSLFLGFFGRGFYRMCFFCFFHALFF